MDPSSLPRTRSGLPTKYAFWTRPPSNWSTRTFPESRKKTSGRYLAAALKLYTINLEDLKLVGCQTSAHRFHKVVWSLLDFGTATTTNPNGVIVGGCEGGVIQVYSASKLLAGENALMVQQVKHNGAVRSMDFNPYQN
ncbi:hypothetical protein quinque_008796 [Culex quinquefasciatus]